MKRSDAISSGDLASFGRSFFLDADLGGARDAFSLVAALHAQCYPTDGPGYRAAIDELERHAVAGEWATIGAWKFSREFLGEDPAVLPLIDNGLRTLERMGVANLGIHLSAPDTERFRQIIGKDPPNDGFWGPPTFTSDFGPSREFFLEEAVRFASTREIQRVPCAHGVPPGDVMDAYKAMWDFGMLVHRGPRVVPPDISSEPEVVKPAVVAATGVDHGLFVEELVEVVNGQDARYTAPWTSIGVSRFAEDYLEPSVIESEVWGRVTDAGLRDLREGGFLGLAVAPATLTARQRARLDQMPGEGTD